LPPKLAPIHVVIIPIYRKPGELEKIREKVEIIMEQIPKNVVVKFDDRDTQKPGWKFAEYELKGVPIRLAIGPRDLENNTIEMVRRDTLEKSVVPMETIGNTIELLLEEIQESIYNKALKFRETHMVKTDSYEEFKNILDENGGFILAHWDGTTETEDQIKSETKATIRCIPLDAPLEEGKCIYSGKSSSRRVIFARAY
jgi:prolyl-tRNA synthetase